MVRTKKPIIYRIAFLATLLAFTVVILGAYTRLKDAGLGCPDWPTCYGQITVPKTLPEIMSAHKLYPNQPVEATKAWPEMIHRYFAGTLGLLIFGLAVYTVWQSVRSRTNRTAFTLASYASWQLQQIKTNRSLKIVLLLVGCIIFQALLGMWTVTWQLLPLIVMGHLLGGMMIVTLLWWLTLTTGQLATPANSLHSSKPWAIAGMIIVILQIFLGGWTSANYASIVCPNFPFCQGSLFPQFDFTHAFNFFSPIGKNYQGGVLGTTARITIQMMHRYGAFITFTYLTIFNLYILFAKKTDALKNTAGMILLILVTQIFLGIMNVATLLYLPIAVTHNAVALLLLLAVTTLTYQLYAPTKQNASLHKINTLIGEHT